MVSQDTGKLNASRRRRAEQEEQQGVVSSLVKVYSLDHGNPEIFFYEVIDSCLLKNGSSDPYQFNSTQRKRLSFAKCSVYATLHNHGME